MSSHHKSHNILNISQIKKQLDIYNPYNSEKINSINNRTAPGSYKKYNTINNINSNSYTKFPNYTEINFHKNVIKDKEKENNKLKIKITELEKEIKKQKIKYKNQILSLREENKKYKIKNHEIPINNINKDINNKLYEEIKKLKKKINLLSDENICLLTDKKNLKNKIMELKKDKQYLIEQISDLNQSLNNKIKPKLNENENNLMSLKNQILELKNQNDRLIKENNNQKEIIQNLKEEIYDIHQKTSLLCKDTPPLKNIKYEDSKTDNYHMKNILSMKNLRNYNKNPKYGINLNINNPNKKGSLYNLEKDDIRLNTEYITKNNNVNPFYKSKNINSYNYIGCKSNKNYDDNIGSIIDSFLNKNKKRENKTPKYNKLNKFSLLNKNDESYNKENNEYYTNIKNNPNYFIINNKNGNYNYPYYMRVENYNNNIKEYDKYDKYEEIKSEISKTNNLFYNKSLLSDYIDEDNYNY